MIVSLGIVVATLSMGVTGASADATAVKHCITPTAVDLNERWGISDAIVAPFCIEVNSGRRWVPSSSWFMNSAFDAAPAGFAPAGATPLADFVAKFIGVKYVVDPGTKQEKTYVFPKEDILGIFHVPGTDIVNPMTLGSLRPLSVGDHVVDTYMVFSAMHCDGFSAVVEESCLLAGENLYQSVAFRVTPGHN
jgi:hypothetical protein